MPDIEPGAFDGKPAGSWGETARRLRILRRHLSNPSSGIAGADAAAAEIGVGRRMLYHLVESISSKPSPKPAGRPDRRLNDAVEDVIAEAIAACPADAPFHVVGVEARRMAATRGLPPPSDRATASRVRTARYTEDVARPPARIAIDHAPLEIAVVKGASSAAPWITVAIDLTRQEIVAFRISLNAPTPTWTKRVASDALGRIGTTKDPPTILIQGQQGQDWAGTRRALRRRGAIVSGTNQASLPLGAAVQRSIGGRIAGIPIRPKLDPTLLRRRIRAMTPIDLDLLASIVAHRLEVPPS